MLRAVHDTIRVNRNPGGHGHSRRLRASAASTTSTATSAAHTTTKSPDPALIPHHPDAATDKPSDGVSVSTLVFYNSRDTHSPDVTAYMKHRFAEGVMLIDHTKYDTIIKALFSTSGRITPQTIVLVDHDRLWTPSNSPLWSTETRQLMRTYFKTKLYTFTPGYVQLYNPGFFKVNDIESMMIKETDYKLTQLELVEGWSTKY